MSHQCLSGEWCPCGLPMVPSAVASASHYRGEWRALAANHCRQDGKACTVLRRGPGGTAGHHDGLWGLREEQAMSKEGSKIIIAT